MMKNNKPLKAKPKRLSKKSGSKAAGLTGEKLTNRYPLKVDKKPVKKVTRKVVKKSEKKKTKKRSIGQKGIR